MAWLMHHVKAMCHGSPVAETFLIGWSFSMLLEGMPGQWEALFSCMLLRCLPAGASSSE
jgi:hypothetical protein